MHPPPGSRPPQDRPGHWDMPQDHRGLHPGHPRIGGDMPGQPGYAFDRPRTRILNQIGRRDSPKSHKGIGVWPRVAPRSAAVCCRASDSAVILATEGYAWDAPGLRSPAYLGSRGVSTPPIAMAPAALWRSRRDHLLKFGGLGRCGSPPLKPRPLGSARPRPSSTSLARISRISRMSGDAVARFC